MQDFEPILLNVRYPNRIYAPQLYSMSDCITVLNFTASQFDYVLISKKWYKALLDNDLLDYCTFSIKVSIRTNVPVSPQPFKYVDVKSITRKTPPVQGRVAPGSSGAAAIYEKLANSSRFPATVSARAQKLEYMIQSLAK